MGQKKTMMATKLRSGSISAMTSAGMKRPSKRTRAMTFSIVVTTHKGQNERPSISGPSQEETGIDWTPRRKHYAKEIIEVAENENQFGWLFWFLIVNMILGALVLGWPYIFGASDSSNAVFDSADFDSHFEL